MAKSPSHTLGELIGDFFEESIIKYLHDYIPEGYYLDYRHSRKARNGKKEVIWADQYGNKHKLDIVIEKHGTEKKFGTPSAFIEMAWRRYTKHSKNKVQEISGAILPLVEKYGRELPFYAAVLAGEFTDNAITQLQSQGFFVLHFSYEEICKVYDAVNISIHWEESSNDVFIQEIADEISEMTKKQKETLYTAFVKQQKKKLKKLSNSVTSALSQSITEITVVPLHGFVRTLRSINDAITYIMDYDENDSNPILRYEITVRYNNSVEYTMRCPDKTRAIQFLNHYINKK